MTPIDFPGMGWDLFKGLLIKVLGRRDIGTAQLESGDGSHGDLRKMITHFKPAVHVPTSPKYNVRNDDSPIP